MLDGQRVAGQWLADDDPAQVEGEVGGSGEAAGFGVQMAELERPAARLAARMLARHAVEPALDPAPELEVGGVDGQHERVVEDAPVEPVGQDELHALAAPGGEHPLFPFVDPGEAMTLPLRPVADRRAYGRRLQARQRALQKVVLLLPGAAPDGGQKLVGREPEEARGRQAGIRGIDELATGPDQDVGIPDRGHAVLGDGVDLHLDAPRSIEDRRHPAAFRQREERSLHQVALVATGWTILPDGLEGQEERSFAGRVAVRGHGAAQPRRGAPA